MASYATERKIRIISEKLGDNWREHLNGRSIDSFYNELVGDTRKNLFCKLRPEVKSKLDELVDEHDMKMAEYVEILIEEAYARFETERDNIGKVLSGQFGGL